MQLAHGFAREVAQWGLLAPLAFVCLFVSSCGDNNSSSTCFLNSDCSATASCIEGVCVPECRENRDCEQGRCVDNACLGDAEPADAAEDANEPNDTATDANDDAPSDTAVDSDDDAAADTGDDSDPVDDSGSTDAARPDGVGEITGQVHFRLYDDSILPVAEPLVYWTLPEQPPAPLAIGASCECGVPAGAAVGAADGRFTLTDVPAGDVLLVVQKGEFRRVRLIEVVADASVEVPRETTELPARDDPELGDEVPDIVIGTGRFDPIEDIFAKLRMGPVTSEFGFDYRAYLEDPDAWGVELMWYQDPGEFDDDRLADLTWSTEVDDYLDLLSDWERLAEVDFVFSPCAATDRYRALLTSAAVRENLSRYVNEGGKLYATDFAYDVVEQPFATYIDFTNPAGEDTNADGRLGETDRLGLAARDTRRYESHNRPHTPLLRQWLLALDPSHDGFVGTHGNWVTIEEAGSGERCCRDGAPVEVETEVIMSGPNFEDRGGFVGEGVHYDTWDEAEADGGNHPHTLRFPYGCGEVMYSTYHTTEFFERTASLSEQERVLIWLLLEINQCNLDPIKE